MNRIRISGYPLLSFLIKLNRKEKHCGNCCILREFQISADGRHMDENEKKALRKELDFYQKRGVNLYLEGRASSPARIVRACAVAENGTYMRDYGQDERGRLRRIDFNLVEKE